MLLLASMGIAALRILRICQSSVRPSTVIHSFLIASGGGGIVVTVPSRGFVRSSSSAIRYR